MSNSRATPGSVETCPEKRFTCPPALPAASPTCRKEPAAAGPTPAAVCRASEDARASSPEAAAPARTAAAWRWASERIPRRPSRALSTAARKDDARRALILTERARFFGMAMSSGCRSRLQFGRRRPPPPPAILPRSGRPRPAATSATSGQAWRYPAETSPAIPTQRKKRSRKAR